MPILTIILVMALVAVIVWALVTYLPMPAPFKTLIIVVAVALLLWWILQETGMLGSLQGVRV